MATWAEFERAAPEMAALGMKQFQKFGLGYLGTTRKDGAPRVHPVCPVIARGRLFVATAPTSPKRLDLLRDGRYVLHALPGKEEEEFLVRGRAHRVTDDATRAMVTDPSNRLTNADLNIKHHEWLFEYDIEQAATTHWHNVGQPNTRPIRAKWREVD
jgi:Pyridoxamine 5'-phosphate oxidase